VQEGRAVRARVRGAAGQGARAHQKYLRYPRGSDGLFNQGFKRFVYVLEEELTLVGPAATLRGARQLTHPFSIIDVDDRRALLLEQVANTHDGDD
jgi:hypothetical protein